MASVFGLEVTNPVVRAEPEYTKKKTITREDRAYVAHKKKFDGDKDKEARGYVEVLRVAEVGWSNATLCMVYNATGDTLRFVREYSWHGTPGASPYPQEIRNGQWGGFLHKRSSSGTGFEGSMGCVVYRGVNGAGHEYDWLLGWMNLFRGDNHAYTEIRRAHGFDDNVVNWDTIADNMNYPGLTHSADMDRCSSAVAIGQDMHAVFEAEMNIDSNPPTQVAGQTS